MITMPIELYTDGSSLKNPGPSGLAYIIRYWEAADENQMPEAKLIEGNQGFRLSTNNRMELMAGIYGLRKVIEKIDEGVLAGAKQINLTSDSDYFVKAINQNWVTRWQQNQWMTSAFNGAKPRPVKNKDLWETILAIQDELRNRGIILTMTHIEGHSGHEFNERADHLAVAASGDSSNHAIDEEYEKTAVPRTM